MLVMFCGAGALDLGVIRPLVCLVITQRQLKSGRQQISPEIKESMLDTLFRLSEQYNYTLKQEIAIGQAAQKVMVEQQIKNEGKHGFNEGFVSHLA